MGDGAAAAAPSRFRTICVFCGSSAGHRKVFADAALELGHELISGESIGEVKVVDDMHQRKAEMARQSEAFIALPGGYGTMEELLEMITWCQLGIHDKPVGLLNVDGYYDPLIALFEKGATEGFINPDCKQIFVSAPTASELLTKMEQYTRLHQEVAPATTWEISELGYGKGDGAPAEDS
ncbi:unnamed protein product [Urochloa decumbens]|uniref:Cytokinin riboside 5'-monophosphate phosphoribohydrolase n=1 Tax=Urochloa decumbens TaxID=240449 RepID=A0ABC8WGC9_9POAL